MNRRAAIASTGRPVRVVPTESAERPQIQPAADNLRADRETTGALPQRDVALLGDGPAVQTDLVEYPEPQVERPGLGASRYRDPGSPRAPRRNCCRAHVPRRLRLEDVRALPTSGDASTSNPNTASDIGVANTPWHDGSPIRDKDRMVAGGRVQDALVRQRPSSRPVREPRWKW